MQAAAQRVRARLGDFDVHQLPDEPARPRWIAVCGGKLTTYRDTAAKVMRLLAPSLPSRQGKDTATIALVGEP